MTSPQYLVSEIEAFCAILYGAINAAAALRKRHRTVRDVLFHRKQHPSMHTLITISLAVNIAVLIPIVVLMIIKSPLVDHAWGAFTPARGILLSMYGTILLLSCTLILMPIPAFVAALLLVQVIYKITTPLTVGSITNPIVISNLLIAVVHCATLMSISSTIGNTLFSIG
jgi:hypothetical protein